MTLHSKMAGKTATLFLVTILFFSGARATTYYVAPDGDDGNSGSESAPFATLHKARDALREVSGGEKIVVLRQGDYFLESTLTFTEKDNGTAQNPVVFKNYPGETPRVFGGKQITGWESAGNNIYRANIGTDWQFWTLSENSVRSQNARHPNHKANSRFGAYIRPDVGDKHEIHYSAGEFPSQWDHGHSRVVHGANGWFPCIHPVSEVDFNSRVISVDPEPYIGRTYDYIVEGSKDFIDAPGEWAIGTDGYVYYQPYATPIDDQVIVGATMKRVVEFLGSASSSPVKHIVFEGIILSTSDCTPIGLSNKQRIDNPSTQGDQGNCEGDYTRHGLVHLENAEDIIVRYCKIVNAGIMGVLVNKHAQRNIIYGNWIDGINYVAVYLTGHCASTGPWEYVNKHNEVVNNYITNFGMLWANGSGVQLYQSGDNQINHNEIRGGDGGRRYAISQKGNYFVPGGVQPPCPKRPGCLETMMHTRNNSFHFNDISDVMSSTRDVGAFEAWNTGFNHGLINNRFHDILEWCEWMDNDAAMHGIYLDGVDHYSLIRNIYYNFNQGVTWSAKGFSGQMVTSDMDMQSSEADARIAAESYSGSDWEGIGLLSDFPWDNTPMGKGNHPGLSFDVPYGDGTGLYAEYFNNNVLSGTPVLTRVDSMINFIYGKAVWPVFHMEDDSIYDSIGVGELAIRWAGKILPRFSEEYTFYAHSNNGVRLWIDDQPVIDEWSGGKSERTGSIALTAGTLHDFKMEYYHESTGRHKGVQLRWASESQHYRYVPQSQLYLPEAVAGKMPGVKQTRNRFPIAVQVRSGRVDISCRENYEWDIALIDPAGRLVFHKKGTAPLTQKLDMKSRASGLYFVKCTAGEMARIVPITVPSGAGRN
ncbi:MAG: hypothetical protein GF350_15345 [Chitinivibrionales bacterium]|nr:hypothetical protein [Chitinivibrionales bacterium]